MEEPISIQRVYNLQVKIMYRWEKEKILGLFKLNSQTLGLGQIVSTLIRPSLKDMSDQDLRFLPFLYKFREETTFLNNYHKNNIVLVTTFVIC